MTGDYSAFPSECTSELLLSSAALRYGVPGVAGAKHSARSMKQLLMVCNIGYGIGYGVL